MKKTLFSMLIIASYFSVANAQLMVDENGRIGMNIDTTATLISNVSINSLGESTTSVFIKQDAAVHTIGLGVRKKENYGGSGNFLMSVSGRGDVEKSNNNIGIYGGVWSNTALGSGRAFGVMGIAGGSTSGWNYGVSGMLTSTGNGAGIYGSTTNDSGTNTGGRYAGYFNGPVKVTGTLTAQSVVNLSDYRVKKNIRSISNSSLDNIMSMNVVEYNYDADLLMPIDDSDTASIAARSLQLNKEKSLIAAEKHYGLIAQELQQLYPNLVKESQDGYLTINYIELIPLLISSIQELKAELDAVKDGGNLIMRASPMRGATTDVISLDAVVTALYQNEPNPFTERTVIRVDVAESVVAANLYIYNMNGEQLTEYPITNRGATSITIDGGSLNAGMYLYALIADGQVIDTKRMILTK